MTYALRFSDCQNMLAGKSDRGNGVRAKLRHNTYLYQRSDDSFAVQYHSTDVVTIYRDGTYKLSTGGWNTPTTWPRISEYGPAHVFGMGKGEHGISTGDDPLTAPKVQKCRQCHGTGKIHYDDSYRIYGEREGYETKTETVKAHDPYGRVLCTLGYACREHDATGPNGDGSSVWYRSDPDLSQGTWRNFHGGHYEFEIPSAGKRGYGRLDTPELVSAAHDVDCYQCNGTGRYDYGSKPRPIIFYDGIVVDYDGVPVNRDDDRFFATPEELAEKAAVRTKAMLKEHKRERNARLKLWGVKVYRGRAKFIKCVSGDDYAPQNGGAGFHYRPGNTVTAPDWIPTFQCGNGLHLSPTPSDARGYVYSRGDDESNLHYLECSVRVSDMIILGADKVKVPTVKVERELTGEEIVRANMRSESYPF